MNHQAIYNTHPNVKSVVDVENGVVAYDASGNVVTLDTAVVEAETITVENDWNFQALRRKRNRLLAETDWVSMKALDASIDGLGIQLPQVWMDYRQALRDLPANTTDPANPDWPVKPGGEA